jgi:hypothetical protein
MEVSFQLQILVSFIRLSSPLNRGRSPCFRPQTCCGHCNEQLDRRVGNETPIFRSVDRYLQSRQDFIILLTSAQRRPPRKTIHRQSRVGQTLCDSCAFICGFHSTVLLCVLWPHELAIDHIYDWGSNEDFTTFFRPPWGSQRHAQAEPGGTVEIGHICSSIV